MSQSDLQVRALTKIFDTPEGPVTAVKEVNLDVQGDEFFSLLGPSGCGKTTTLRMIAGLETISSGEIRFNGRDLARLPPAQRNLGMVFQSYALFPHLTVFENAAYGLRVRKSSHGNPTKRVNELLDILGLDGLGKRYPTDLSGGQQQRVSIARALAYEPDMFLLDEPLANLDAKLRVQMREEIRRIQKELGVLALYVTHDQEEAMSVSDRIGVFRLGLLMQVGTPEQVYRHPTSLFVADFIGKINFFPAELLSGDTQGGRVRLSGGYEVTTTRFEKLTENERVEFGVPGDAVVAVRPEHIKLAPEDGEGVPGRVRRVLFLGSVVRYFVESPHALREVMVETADPAIQFQEGQNVMLGFNAEHALCFHR